MKYTKNDTSPQMTPDEIWIYRRKTLAPSPQRIALDLRQLADEIEEIANSQAEKEAKMRELLGAPRGLSVLK